MAGILLMGIWGGPTGLAVDPSPPASNARQIPQGLSQPFAAGPQGGITCPAGAINISPGTNIQTFVNAYPGNSTFCLKAGVHPITSAITPKTDNSFVGEYGAVLDGTGWTATDVNQGAFRAHNQNIDDVTIRNLVIRNMPQKGIHAFYNGADNWTIEFNEITANKNTGVEAPNHSVVRRNSIHHNASGGYSAYRAVSTIFEANDIAYNGGEQKLVATIYCTFRNNFVHHNTKDGIWYDADNTGALIEGNLVEDNGRDGIVYEISGQGIIRRNIIRRNGSSGILVSTSKNLDIYDNRIEDNFRGIQYFLNCEAVGGGALGWDLTNNIARDNIVRVGTRAGSSASGFSNLSNCTSTQVAPYLSGSKNLKFINISYIVPSTAAKYWLWGRNSFRSWSEWRALGQDAASVLSK